MGSLSIADGSCSTLRAGLSLWAAQRLAPDAAIADIQNLGGHSGQTFGFAVLGPGGRQDLVIRIAPAGVARRGSTDVLRQAPLLQSLHIAGVRTPRVIEACDDEAFFGAPFLIVERLKGAPLIMGPNAVQPDWARNGRQEAYCRAAEELARLHSLGPLADLSDWDQPRSPRDEIEAWVALFERSIDPVWASEGAALRRRLLQTLPPTYRLGVCHGDFQTNNVLFALEDGAPRVTGVIDWEVAHIGAVEHDLAWFLMMNDPQAWDPVEQRGGVDLDAIRACYETALGGEVANLAWFRALAGYRIAAIAAYNIRLHRTGRRLDEDWERAASSMPVFFARAHALLDQP
jgi:aminoglycoside phosphotransferase (APT) family kinase protein